MLKNGDYQKKRMGDILKFEERREGIFIHKKGEKLEVLKDCRNQIWLVDRLKTSKKT